MAVSTCGRGDTEVRASLLPAGGRHSRSPQSGRAGRAGGAGSASLLGQSVLRKGGSPSRPMSRFQLPHGRKMPLGATATHTHTRAHTHTHSRTHSHTHTHTHKRTQARRAPPAEGLSVGVCSPRGNRTPAGTLQRPHGQENSLGLRTKVRKSVSHTQPAWAETRKAPRAGGVRGEAVTSQGSSGPGDPAACPHPSRPRPPPSLRACLGVSVSLFLN